MQHLSMDRNYFVKVDFVSVKENRTKIKTGKNKAVLSLTTSHLVRERPYLTKQYKCICMFNFCKLISFPL